MLTRIDTLFIPLPRSLLSTVNFLLYFSIFSNHCVSTIVLYYSLYLCKDLIITRITLYHLSIYIFHYYSCSFSCLQQVILCVTCWSRATAMRISLSITHVLTCSNDHYATLDPIIWNSNVHHSLQPFWYETSALPIFVPARSSNHFQAIAYVHYLEPTTTCLWRSSYYKMGYIQVEDNIENSIVSMSVSLKAAWGRLPVGVFRLSTLIRLLWLSIAISCPFSGSVEWGKVISACGLRWETVCQKPR